MPARDDRAVVDVLTDDQRACCRHSLPLVIADLPSNTPTRAGKRRMGLAAFLRQRSATESSDEAGVQGVPLIMRCEGVIVLLTRGVLGQLHTLLAVYHAARAAMPVLTVHLDRGGYDYDVGAAELARLHETLDDDAKARP